MRSYTCSKFRKSYTPPAARIRVNDGCIRGKFFLDVLKCRHLHLYSCTEFVFYKPCPQSTSAQIKQFLLVLPMEEPACGLLTKEKSLYQEYIHGSGAVSFCTGGDSSQQQMIESLQAQYELMFILPMNIRTCSFKTMKKDSYHKV